ncbi:growth-regulating factor 1-like [Diospyros lotus]|uniref:growth-regulating factor 1-like n=1 Tax=Diospyros lotus TaxID=55363 RepID=UPI00225BBFA2|nr:growth-regulating factor 1-like [Diospyros lotus]
MSGNNRFPFTPNQWQELEHQALVYKYMVSSIPIPPDLLFNIRRSLESNLILHQPQHTGWSCFETGLGRKIDPEPGRCRRTDGKKWRCSKEAYPDSKYCERHMHRGRNRSRKPVEIMATPPPPPPSNPSISSSSRPNHSLCNNPPHCFLFPHSSPPTQQLLNPHKDYRYVCGVKEEVGEHALFSASSMDNNPIPWQLTMVSSSSTAHLKQRTGSALQSGHPFLQLQGLSDAPKQEQDQRFHLGNEKVEKVMHHFLDDGPKNQDPWLHSEDKSCSFMPVSTTQLSISTPNSSHDFFSAP